MTRRRTFPLLPRRRVAATPFGTVRSARRGPGTDVAGSRPYVPGDRLAAIDWRASAKLSAATGRDEFLVRQTFAEDAPRVVVVCDRSPTLALYDDPYPFLSKRAAIAACVELIAASARAARADVGWCDIAADGEFWVPPRPAFPADAVERRLRGDWNAPPGALSAALADVARRHTEVPPGTFLFVLSDFLVPGDAVAWRFAARRGLDLVPVVVQDPTWESSFPDVAGTVVPVADPGTGRVRGIRLSRAEARARRDANAARAERLRREFRRGLVDPVWIAASDEASVDAAFAGWAARRRALTGIRAHA